MDHELKIFSTKREQPWRPDKTLEESLEGFPPNLVKNNNQNWDCCRECSVDTKIHTEVVLVFRKRSVWACLGVNERREIFRLKEDKRTALSDIGIVFRSSFFRFTVFGASQHRLWQNIHMYILAHWVGFAAPGTPFLLHADCLLWTSRHIRRLEGSLLGTECYSDYLFNLACCGPGKKRQKLESNSTLQSK